MIKKIVISNLLLVILCATQQSLTYADDLPKNLQFPPTESQPTKDTLPLFVGQVVEKQIVKKDGNFLTVSCEGIGITESEARKSALEQCKKSAVVYLDDSIKVDSKVWTTGDDVYFASETDSNKHFTGLDCEVLNEKNKEMNYQTKTSIICKFDLSKAVLSEEAPARQFGKKMDLNTPPEPVPLENKSVRIAVFPTCDHILIVGSKKMVCSGNAMIFGVKKTTEEIIVEKAGYIPYKLKLTEDSQTFMVMLQPTNN